jgi:hypothetical protein
MRRVVGSDGIAENSLHDAVLTGVVRENDQTTAGGQHVQCGFEARLQDGELVVHSDPDRLERAVGRVAAPAPGRGGYGCSHEVGELCGGLDRPGGEEGACDAASETGFATVPEDGDKLLFRCSVHNIGRRPAGRAIHAHVERCVKAVTEPPLGGVELVTRDA